MFWCFIFHPKSIRIIPVSIKWDRNFRPSVCLKRFQPEISLYHSHRTRRGESGTKKIIVCIPSDPDLNFQLPNECWGLQLLFDISYLALLAFKSHERINTYKPVPRPPHLTIPFYLMQLINLQVRLARADTRLTVRIYFSVPFNSAVNC